MFSRLLTYQSAMRLNSRSAYYFFQIIFASLFIGLLAQVRIPLPGNPVPITLQTFAVLLVGSFLGRKRGSLAILAYFGEILVGLPVLTGALSKPLAFFGPHAGYLLGFIPLAYLAGWIFERKPTFSRTAACFFLTLACFLQLSMGSLWLANFVGIENSFNLGFTPFIPGEMLKVLAVSAIFCKLKKPIQ